MEIKSLDLLARLSMKAILKDKKLCIEVVFKLGLTVHQSLHFEVGGEMLKDYLYQIAIP